jgi:hypothetical protein
MASIAAGIFLFQGSFLMAQSTLDALRQDLDAAKQQHDQVTAQTLDNFFSNVDAAMASPDAAINLYQQAGGTMPSPAPVVTAHENETATERSAREAVDKATQARLGAMLQLHCGLLHYGALFIVKPTQKGLQNDFVTWLRSASASYPQINTTTSSASEPAPRSRKRDGNGGGGQQAPFNFGDIKGKTLHDSIIAKFLGFNAWGDKDQGKWAVGGLPDLFRANVLDPSRNSPTAETLAAWDIFIAMRNSDVTDNDQWNQVIYPPLQFDRASDDYTIAPATEKLEGLVNIIKANPTHPKADDWIARVKSFLESYAASHGGARTTSAPAPTPAATNAAPANPNVTVTTQQQGDMTIITTHTNSAPAGPTAP